MKSQVMRIVLHTRARLGPRIRLARRALRRRRFGRSVLHCRPLVARPRGRQIATGPWEWTDDAEMACNLGAELRDHGAVDQTRLAMTFAGRCEPYRGYGAGAFT